MQERHWSARKQALFCLVADTISTLDVARSIMSYSSDLICVAASMANK
jgi:hypothetical protein